MKKLSVISIVMLMVLFVYPLHSNAATINLKFASFFPPVAPQSKLWNGFCEEVQKRTNGDVKIFFYPGGSLVDAMAMNDAIEEGIVDIGYTVTGFTPGRFPVSEATIVQIGYPNAYITGRVGWDFYKNFKPKEWDKSHILSIGGTGPMCIWSTKPISNQEQISGQKLRGIGPVAEVTKLLGASPVGTPTGELYDAITKGVIVGAIMPAEAGRTWRLAEICKYVTLTWRVFPAANVYVAMNKKSYEKLPPEINKVFNEISAEWNEKHVLLWNDAELAGYKFGKEKDVTFIDLPKAEAEKWKQNIIPLKTKYMEDMQKKGYSEEQILSWFKFLDERIDFWRAKQKESGLESIVPLD